MAAAPTPVSSPPPPLLRPEAPAGRHHEPHVTGRRLTTTARLRSAEEGWLGWLSSHPFLELVRTHILVCVCGRAGIGPSRYGTVYRAVGATLGATPWRGPEVVPKGSHAEALPCWLVRGHSSLRPFSLQPPPQTARRQAAERGGDGAGGVASRHLPASRCPRFQHSRSETGPSQLARCSLPTRCVLARAGRGHKDA